MSINIKTSTGLLEIGGEVTKSKVISALGYTPSDKRVVDGHVDDNDIHITAAERAKWNSANGGSDDYNDLINKPNIIDDGSGELMIQDKSGNSTFKVDANGIRTTSVDTNTLTLNNIAIKTETWTFTLEDGSTVTKAVLVG